MSTMPPGSEGWRIGTPIRKGKKKQEQIGIVIQVVSLSDDNNDYDHAYIRVLWETGKIDAPHKQDIHNFRNNFKQSYKSGLGDRSLNITKEQFIKAWCACPPPP